MIRVLHVMGCADAGGISAVVLNYYRFIDRTKIHFDIALTVPEAGQNAYALEALGAEIFFLPLKSNGMYTRVKPAMLHCRLQKNWGSAAGLPMPIPVLPGKAGRENYVACLVCC